MKLVVISNPDTVIDENIIINNLFKLGLKYFHIRKANHNATQVSKLIEEIHPQYYSYISLHQHHQLAKEYGIKRLHYTEQARAESDIKKWQAQIDAGYSLSTSIHSPTLLHTFKLFDYVFYGPVFNSISKPGYQGNVPADFKLDKDYPKPDLFALGGVDASNLRKLKAMNFDGAAALGAIWNDPDKAIISFKQLKENLPL
ncbi:thiamine phosphate synthase [Mucilaginibacter sp. L196]|uniref:thiamine phosphate synthase n=1 Tax=Mucilaginibacter sp. L196 TaxID=1641870 RepID=UPI00131D9086|nr:thiamine phosphate synthase [Mucilaginibacter sp. L196]